MAEKRDEDPKPCVSLSLQLLSLITNSYKMFYTLITLIINTN